MKIVALLRGRDKASGYAHQTVGIPKYLGRLRRETLIPLPSVRKAEKTTVNLHERFVLVGGAVIEYNPA